MRLAVLKERHAGEKRVAATPDTVKKLIALGLDVVVESGAGVHSAITDAEFSNAGASIAPDAASALDQAGILFAVQAPEAEIRALIAPGTLLIGMLNAVSEPELAPALAEGKVDAAALELLPRITRAQSMDVLSSQANLAGYRAVIEAAGAFARAFPMMMTAAGTVPPARVFVIGAGVAGLQAIATARRLGGIVSATDVRPAAKEEIKSLGAAYIGVDDEESARQTGPYAGQMSEVFRQKQSELMAATVAKNDLIICTALVQGRKAPVIVTREMVAEMRPGSVVVDLAADAGGNCGATVPGELSVTPNGVTILGHHNWPARIPVAASALYARNLLTFLTNFWDKETKTPKLAETDDLIKGVLLTRDGRIVHPSFQSNAAA
jgi:NAD(P) transhydrogenase subunit alpha